MNYKWKRIIPHLLAVLVLIVLCAAYFAPQLSGKKIQTSDQLAHKAASKELSDYEERTGEFLLWTNSMFGGMPTYQISIDRSSDFLIYIKKILRLGVGIPMSYFLTLLLVAYIALILLKVNPWLSLLGALAIGFTTNNMILAEAGHSNKLWTIAFLPLVISGMYLTFKKNYLSGALVFTSGLALALSANHPQMTYYFAICTAILFILYAIRFIRQKDYKPLGIATAIFILGAIIALATTAYNYLPTYEYSQSTMRGGGVLESEGTRGDAGLDYEYAMQWSNGWRDLLASLIPRAVGGSSGERIKSGAFYNVYSRNAAPLPDGSYQAPLYWGDLPFTSGPAYFGAAALLLFLFSLFLVKKPLKWWLVGSVVLTLLLSLGDNLDWFQRLFYNYFPVYDKFRTPNSILSITPIFIGLGIVVGLKSMFLKAIDKDRLLKYLYISTGVLGGICLILALFGTALFDFTHQGDGQYPAQIMDLIVQDRQAMMRADAFRSLIFILISAAAVWAFIKGKIKKTALLGILIVSVAFDFWGINKRYINVYDFETQQMEASFSPRPADQKILAQEESRGDYRVYDLSVNTFNTAIPSYHHNTIGGYHAAKLQRYQDLIDRHISQNNIAVLNMLNAKYFITPEGEVQENPQALGPVWLIDDIKVVSTAEEEINALNEIDPATTAVVHTEFGEYIAGLDPTGEGTIRLEEYDPQNLTYHVDVPSEQLAVFSEIWYDPDKGWNAYIDGDEVEFIRVNYALRGLKIPQGSHSITFKFEPTSYATGQAITFVSSLLLVLLIVAGLVYFGMQWWKKTAPKPAPKKSKKKNIRKRKTKR